MDPHIISIWLFACVSFWKLEDGVYWGGSETVYLQSTVSPHSPAIPKNRNYNDDLSNMPLRNSFPRGFKDSYPPPHFFARHDYKLIDKVWAMVLGTAPKTNLLPMMEMAGWGEETEISSLYIVTRIS